MSKLIIPTPLRKFTNNEGSFNSSGSTVREVIHELVSTHDGLKKHLLDDNGNIRSFVRVYVGEDDIKSLNNDLTPVAQNDIVSIIPAIAGGIA
ncbi:MAG: MoaD/ThiS family protein [Flavobacteriales bacterium]|nr:MoaD/ThiS family protein [Flavobacteriales bacterium]